MRCVTKALADLGRAYSVLACSRQTYRKGLGACETLKCGTQGTMAVSTLHGSLNTLLPFWRVRKMVASLLGQQGFIFRYFDLFVHARVPRYF